MVFGNESVYTNSSSSVVVTVLMIIVSERDFSTCHRASTRLQFKNEKCKKYILNKRDWILLCHRYWSTLYGIFCSPNSAVDFPSYKKTIFSLWLFWRYIMEMLQTLKQKMMDLVQFWQFVSPNHGWIIIILAPNRGNLNNFFSVHILSCLKQSLVERSSSPLLNR